jgi:hypothetical protein
MLGASVFVASGAPDMGEVSFCSSHAVTADRSYVYPSSTSNTGSSKSCWVMGHTSSGTASAGMLGGDTVSDAVRSRSGRKTAFDLSHEGLPGLRLETYPGGFEVAYVDEAKHDACYMSLVTT